MSRFVWDSRVRYRKKYGKYQGSIRHTCKHWDKPDSQQMVYVKFDGNKWSSCVPEDDISVVPDPSEKGEILNEVKGDDDERH